MQTSADNSNMASLPWVVELVPWSVTYPPNGQRSSFVTAWPRHSTTNHRSSCNDHQNLPTMQRFSRGRLRAVPPPGTLQPISDPMTPAAAPASNTLHTHTHICAILQVHMGKSIALWFPVFTGASRGSDFTTDYDHRQLVVWLNESQYTICSLVTSTFRSDKTSASLTYIVLMTIVQVNLCQLVTHTHYLTLFYSPWIPPAHRSFWDKISNDNIFHSQKMPNFQQYKLR